jgi:hypothetical protein
MRVLVACEFSGVVRDAFRARGHDAWSCDLLPSESNPYIDRLKPEQYDWPDTGAHFQADALSVAEDPAYGEWDLMIAHPPCTYLTNSGVRWLANNPERMREMQKAAWFFKSLFNVERIPRIAVENPIPHRYGRLPRYDQIVQPWMFGHGETKATCLWLKNLPKLVPTKIVEGRTPRVHHASPGPDRWKERSRTLPGIADAMAEQWGTI